MTFELTVLGSSSALPTSTKFPAAQVLNAHERFFLIDCGEGTQIQLRKAKVKFGRMNHIFISHLHGDHVFGLFGLLSTLNLLGRKTTMHIFGHSDLKYIIAFYLEHFAPENSYEIEIHPVVKRQLQLIFENKAIEVFAFPLKHKVPTFGYLFREKKRLLNIKKEVIEKYNPSIKQIVEIKKGADLITEKDEIVSNKELTIVPPKPRSFAYCSDTMVYEKITSYIKGVDLLYHEATFLECDTKLAKSTSHSTTVQAATIAKKAGVKKLLIGHFSTRYNSYEEFLPESRKIFRHTEAAEDLSVYTI
ncbi:MAG: ribonuclease Z [Bacteroidales bacterium]|nr:ribonuclease Z [Bacteroidales bacterium]